MLTCPSRSSHAQNLIESRRIGRLLLNEDSKVPLRATQYRLIKCVFPAERFHTIWNVQETVATVFRTFADYGECLA